MLSTFGIDIGLIFRQRPCPNRARLLPAPRQAEHRMAGFPGTDGRTKSYRSCGARRLTCHLTRAHPECEVFALRHLS
jgi:hypothetical protein